MQPSIPFEQMGSVYNLVQGAQSAQSYWSSFSQGRDTLKKQTGKLRYYFDVSNAYVFNKLKILLLPIRHKKWQRERPVGGFGGAGGGELPPPRDDVNAPDLYIPVMAFVTYILLIGLIMGFRKIFHPEVLGMTASSGLVVLALEVIVVRLSFFALSVRTVDVYDLIALCAYKYVGICVDLLLGLLLGKTVYWIALLYLSISNGYFLLRAMHTYMSPEIAPSGGAGERHNHFLLLLAAAQPIIFWFLGAGNLL